MRNLTASKNSEERLVKKIKRREAKKRPLPKISGRSVFQIQAIKRRRVQRHSS